MEDVCCLLCTVMSDSNLIFLQFYLVSLRCRGNANLKLPSLVVYDRVIYSPIIDFYLSPPAPHLHVYHYLTNVILKYFFRVYQNLWKVLTTEEKNFFSSLFYFIAFSALVFNKIVILLFWRSFNTYCSLQSANPKPKL